MRLLSLDYDPVYGGDPDPEATRGYFSSDRTVLDYDIVVWDPAGSLQTYMDYSSRYLDSKLLTEAESVRIKADALRRRRDFMEFLSAGRTLIVVVRPPQTCYAHTGTETYSGTGRNRLTTKQVASFDLLTALPISDPAPMRANGNRVEFIGNGPVARVLCKYKDFLEYEAYLSVPPGHSVANVAGTKLSVGSILKTKSGGQILMLPAMNFAVVDDEVGGDEDEALGLDENEDEDEDEDEEDYVDDALHFQRDLIASLEQLNGVSVASRPPWSEEYVTEMQRQLRSDITKQQERIEAARNDLAELQQRREEDEAKQQLFLGTGRALELEVKNVLELLGGTVSEAEPGRDDWRVSFPEGEAVVEVKGLTKSAAEKHAAQLEKWVAGAIEETGKKYKGILVANTWRETPLIERTEQDFPDQMIPYCRSRDHCLVTGLQLFVMRADVESQPAHAAQWRKTILETTGRLEDCEDWEAILKRSVTTEASGTTKGEADGLAVAQDETA